MEYIAIVGLTIGAFVAGNDIKVIKATVGALPSIFKGSKFTRTLYVDLLAMLFEVLAKVRKEGLMSIENDVENPHESPIFGKYRGDCTRSSCDGVHYRLSAHDGWRQSQCARN